MINKNKINKILLFLFKTSFFIVGLDIFLTSISEIINQDFNKNNSRSEINLNINKHKNFKNIHFVRDIY